MMKKRINGEYISELDIAMIYHGYGREKRFNILSTVGHEIDSLRKSHLKNCYEGDSNGWETGIAVVNGVPQQFCRVGKYIILIDDRSEIRMSFIQRLVYRLFFRDR